ncbi:MAG: CoA transferase [Acidobacteria bacterium]|nr:MAG: CoA transferase [Acidobacteriota bacterium]
MPPPRLPLAGVRVIDLTRALSGPFCTTLLADLGADVVKVESPRGDMIRSWGPFDGQTSLYDVSVNRNKRSVVLDLRSGSGMAALRELLSTADVLVENFRPGVLEDMGLAPEVLRRDFPSLVVTRVSGYGPVGPSSEDPSFDQIAQGMAGFMSVTGLGGQPTRAGVPIADLLTGMFAALGTTAALVGRRTDEPAPTVGVSLVESVLGVMTFHAQRFLSLGESATPAGNEHPVIAPYGIFRCADAQINIAAATQAQWESLCRLLRLDELLDDPDYTDQTARLRNRRRLTELLPRLAAAGVPSGRVNDMQGVFEDPQVQALDVTGTVHHHALGEVRLLRGPIRLDGQLPGLRHPPPAIGEHTDEVLAEIRQHATSTPKDDR